jgi:hypothetical protein
MLSNNPKARTFFVAFRLILFLAQSLASFTLLPLHFFFFLPAPLHVFAYRPTEFWVLFASTTLPRVQATAYWLSFASEAGTIFPEYDATLLLLGNVDTQKKTFQRLLMYLAEHRCPI